VGLLLLDGLGREELQSDGATEPGVFGFPDLAHAALAQALEDLVVADRLSDHDGSILALHQHNVATW